MNLYLPYNRTRAGRTKLTAFIFFLAILFSIEGHNCRAQEPAEPGATATANSIKNSDTSEAATTVTFGHRQLEQMLDDRPGMRECIPDSHPVRSSIIDGFNGELIGQRVYWVDTETDRAFHMQPERGHVPYISIPNDPKVSPIDKWSFAMFEVFNLEGDFNKIHKAAITGRLTKKEFVKQCVELEDIALSKTINFFIKHPLPSSPVDTYYNFRFTIEGLVDQFRYRKAGNNLDNTDYFSDIYDSQITPYLRAVRNEVGRTLWEQHKEKVLEEFDLPNADRK